MRKKDIITELEKAIDYIDNLKSIIGEQISNISPIEINYHLNGTKYKNNTNILYRYGESILELDRILIDIYKELHRLTKNKYLFLNKN